MANYHLHSKTISRGAGRSAVAAAAYRRATVMKDERTDITHYYEKKQGVVHSEMMFPESAPAWTYAFRDGSHEDSRQLWNMIERLEKRDNSQLAREVEFSLPVELTQEQNIRLAQDFIKTTLVDRGMVADWSVHMDNPENPHVHVMLTMRELTENGFGSKKKAIIDPETGEPKRGKEGEIVYAWGDRWGSKQDLLLWRKEWAEKQNEYLKAFGHEVTVDHRSYADRGIELEPTMKLGQGGAGLLERGKESRIGEERAAVRERNRDAILADPRKIIPIISEQKAVFTASDIDEALQRYIKHNAMRAGAVQRAIQSEEVVELSEKDDEFFFTTTSVLETEKRMIQSARELSEATSFAVKERHVDVAVERFNQQLLDATNGAARLSDEQIASIHHVTSGEQLSVVVGMAGAGKTTIMEAAKEAWEAQGYKVRGAALSGIAASNLAESGIASSTLHSMLFNAENAVRMLDAQEGTPLSAKQREYLKEHLIGSKDIIVLDEAAMVGARQMDQLLSLVRESGSKVVLVGDHEQLQSIEAGAAFRTILERLGKSELTEIRRQKIDWMREASQDFAKERTDKALGIYEEKGHVAHVRSFEVKPEPPCVPNEVVLSEAGMSQQDIERFMLVREYLSNHGHASKVVKAAKDADVPLKEHKEFEYYQFYADRRNEIAAELLSDSKASYRVLAYHKVNLEQLAVHAQLHDGVWLKEARQRAGTIVDDVLNPEHLTHAQRIFSDDIVEGIQKGLSVPESELNEKATAFIASVADKAGLSEAEHAHYARVAEYHEMRVRAGEIWHEAQADKIDLKEHDAFPEFCQVKARRDTLAKEIHDRFADHYAYLRHYEISMQELAADYLVAEGTSREGAQSESIAHADLFLNSDTIAPDKRELKPEVSDVLPKMAIASAMTHDQLVSDYMEAYAQDAERSRMVLAYTRKDVAALNQAIREQLIAKGVVGSQHQDVLLTSQDNDGEYQEVGAFAVGDRIMFRSNDKELGVMNGTLGTLTGTNKHQFHVTLDNGREIMFDSREYTRFQHGYAATVHKTQGVTVDETYVLSSKHFDRHSTYVAMTRHKHDVKLYAAANQFRNVETMKRVLSKNGANLSTLDFTEQAERRIEEKQQRLSGLWGRVVRASERIKALQEKVAAHMQRKQASQPAFVASSLLERVSKHDASMPEHEKCVIAAHLAMDRAENVDLPSMQRIAGLKASMQLVADAVDASPEDKEDYKDDVTELQKRMASLESDHHPDGLRLEAKRFRDGLAQVAEALQAKEHDRGEESELDV